MNHEQIDAGFGHITAQQFVRAHLAEIRDPGFWRALNPSLTISERPIAPDAARLAVEPAVVERAVRQIADEGYLTTPPIVPTARLDPLRLAAERVVGAGFPSVFVCVYDEFYQAFQGLDELFAPLLGERYLMVLEGLWTFFVPPSDAGYGLLTSGAPHRDVLGPDPRVIARELPSVINVWIAVTDVGPLDSCIYAVPAPGDPDYFSADRRIRADRFRLQDVRALPAAAGAILGWSTHLAHWGSRSSQFAVAPRVSLAVYFQRRDIPPVHPATIELDAPMPFDTRISWIGSSLGMPLD